MSRLLLRFILAVACLHCNSSFADPDRVYRTDDRDPATIFQTGFQAWGSNNNLVEHIEGATCNYPETGRERTRGSVYISTSRSTQVALNVVRVRLRQMARVNRPPVVWLYTIRPTPDVHSVARTMEASGQTLGTGRLRPVYQTALALDEYVARGAIARETIVGAQRYELVNDQPVAVPNGYLANPNYVEAATGVNPGTLPRSVLTDNATTTGRLRAVISDGARAMLSACWCNTPGPGGASSRAVPSGPTVPARSSCTDQVTTVWPATPKLTYRSASGYWRGGL